MVAFIDFLLYFCGVCSQNKDKLTVGSDMLGASAAIICAVHCSLIPVLSSLGVFQFSSQHNHIFDWVMLGLGVVIAFYSIVLDYFQSHRNGIPFVLCAVGFLLLAFGIATHHSGIPVINLLGALFIVYAHWINHRFKHVKVGA